jgi:dTDP-glucose pyrophosphorylase
VKNNEFQITDDLLIRPDSEIKEAMNKLNSNSLKILLVVDNEGKLVGTLTDGDIRRAILKNIDLNEKISFIYNKKPKYLTEPSIEKAKEIMLNYKITRIPVVDQNMRPTMLFSIEEFLENEVGNENISVVIMAGGEGKRLRPLTSVIPKPLIPINGKTMIETIIDSFYKSNLNRFLISVNYKKELIKSYFSELGKLPYKVIFIEEDKPLGTAGSLYLMKKDLKSTFIVSNCDILLKINYSSALKFHRKRKSHMTIIGSIQEMAVPYGVIRLENEKVVEIEEKPKYHFIVNTGVYIMEPEVLNLIPPNKYIDMTDLIKKAIENKYKVSMYPIHSGWIDIGSWTELKKFI